MKKCKCGTEINDKYITCINCNIKQQKQKTAQSNECIETLQQINWNLGMISKTLQALLPEDKLEKIKKEMKK